MLLCARARARACVCVCVCERERERERDKERDIIYRSGRDFRNFKKYVLVLVAFLRVVMQACKKKCKSVHKALKHKHIYHVVLFPTLPFTYNTKNFQLEEVFICWFVLRSVFDYTCRMRRLLY